VVKCFPSVKPASVYLVAFIDTNLEDRNILLKSEYTESV